VHECAGVLPALEANKRLVLGLDLGAALDHALAERVLVLARLEGADAAPPELADQGRDAPVDPGGLAVLFEPDLHMSGDAAEPSRTPCPRRSSGGP
jgi:hypothetical protein